MGYRKLKYTRFWLPTVDTKKSNIPGSDCHLWIPKKIKYTRFWLPTVDTSKSNIYPVFIYNCSSSFVFQRVKYLPRKLPGSFFGSFTKPPPRPPQWWFFWSFWNAGKSRWLFWLWYPFLLGSFQIPQPSGSVLWCCRKKTFLNTRIRGSLILNVFKYLKRVSVTTKKKRLRQWWCWFMKEWCFWDCWLG